MSLWTQFALCGWWPSSEGVFLFSSRVLKAPARLGQDIHELVDRRHRRDSIFFRLGIGNEVPLRRSDLAMFSLTILLAVGSLFFGHLVLDRSISILAVEEYPFWDPSVNDLRKYQYLTGLAAISMFVISVLNYFMRGAKEWTVSRSVL